MRHNSLGLGIAGGLFLLCTGCSAMIAYSGQDVRQLANKDQVRDSFGVPLLQGIDDGRHFDEYHTRKKISEDQVAVACAVADLQTLGLFEFVLFPYAVCRTTCPTLAGQKLRFEYGEKGEVEQVLINGVRLEQQAQRYWSGISR
jgi:hypothetical protein